MILKLNGMVVEREVFTSFRGLGVWFVRQPNIHTFEAVHRDEEGKEEVIGRYGSFEEAFWAASEDADGAHVQFLYENQDEEDELPLGELHLGDDLPLWEEEDDLPF
jgi:hypothetical protein